VGNENETPKGRAKMKNGLKMNRAELREALKGCDEAKKLLVARGWEELCSVMDDSKTGLSYGTLFLFQEKGKETREFYVNIQTYKVVTLLYGPDGIGL
jgi:hypothetical protein